MTTSKLRRPALLETHPAVGEVKVLILAANPGPRLGDGSENRPGALVEIGGRPVIWHSMMNFAARGFGDFLIATGYRSDDIKRYVSDYNQLDGDLDVNLGDGRVDRGEGRGQAWNADLIETGDETGSAGRIKRAGAGLASGTILLDTGDSLSDYRRRGLPGVPSITRETCDRGRGAAGSAIWQVGNRGRTGH